MNTQLEVNTPAEQIAPAGTQKTSGVRQRVLVPELMDDPILAEPLHHAALAGLRRLNQWSRSTAALWPMLRYLAEKQSSPLRVLDLACGGGDGVVELSRRARCAGIELEIDGCDVSERAVRYASAFAEEHSPAENRFLQLDVLTDNLPDGYDVLTCSLFLHHLAREKAILLLRRMAFACRRAVLIHDLRRTRWGYLLAVAGCRLLTRSPVVHFDGPQSVRAAWSDPEVLELAGEAGLTEARLTHHWPQRFLLCWSKP